MSDDDLFVVYGTNELARDQREFGVIQGTVRANAPSQKWIFQDTDDVQRPDNAVNRGELIVFREGSPAQKDCKAIADRRRAVLR
ncbi:MAG: hypothetical protein V3T64_07815 [Myxococcota bacterium]